MGETSERFWIEVRPLITSSLKPGNFSPILDSLYGSGKPFMFRMVELEDPNVEGRRLIRFYFQAAERIMMEHLSNMAKAVLDVEVAEAEPPRKTYQRCVDLELDKEYALPTSRFAGSPDVNLIDGIVAALAGSGGAVEVVACGDHKPEAPNNHQKTSKASLQPFNSHRD